MKAKNVGVNLHYCLLPSDRWMQSYELSRDTSLPPLPPFHFHISNKYAFLGFLSKKDSGTGLAAKNRDPISSKRMGIGSERTSIHVGSCPEVRFLLFVPPLRCCSRDSIRRFQACISIPYKRTHAFGAAVEKVLYVANQR